MQRIASCRRLFASTSRDGGWSLPTGAWSHPTRTECPARPLRVASVGSLDRGESVSLVEALRSPVGLEGPKPQAVRSCALGELYELAADLVAGQGRLDVELIDPGAVQHKDPDKQPTCCPGKPQLGVSDDVGPKPCAHLLVVMDRRRNRVAGCSAGPQPEVSRRSGVRLGGATRDDDNHVADDDRRLGSTPRDRNDRGQRWPETTGSAARRLPPKPLPRPKPARKEPQALVTAGAAMQRLADPTRWRPKLRRGRLTSRVHSRKCASSNSWSKSDAARRPSAL